MLEEWRENTPFQVLLPLLKSDLYEVIQNTLDGKVATSAPVWHKDSAAVTVVMASSGYPGTYEKGVQIQGLFQISVSHQMVGLFWSSFLFFIRPVSASGHGAAGLSCWHCPQGRMCGLKWWPGPDCHCSQACVGDGPASGQSGRGSHWIPWSCVPTWHRSQSHRSPEAAQVCVK